MLNFVYQAFVSSPKLSELFPSQVSNLSSHQKEPPEVDDTCISGGDLQSRYSDTDHNIHKRSKDSPKEFGAQRGREVLGEE